MTASIVQRALAVIAFAFAIGLPPAAAQDHPSDRDQGTGVVVAPGASTWTAEAYAQKQSLMRDTAATLGKTCTDYAFLGWPPAAGEAAKVIAETGRNYEAAGYTVQQKPAQIPTDTIWVIANGSREAVIQWSDVAGSTIYLSCLTAGAPATTAPPQ
jgi:hypothetical protein